MEGNTSPENDGFQGTSKLLSPLEASQLLTDEYSAKILLATYKRKISAQEISQRYAIPILPIPLFLFPGRAHALERGPRNRYHLSHRRTTASRFIISRRPRVVAGP